MSDTGTTARLVILDRDGVINHDSDDYIKSLDEWIPIPGSIEAIAALSKAGYLIGVATNQSGLARGYFDEIALAHMHTQLSTLVEDAGGRIDALCYCPHGPEEGCNCRKPAPGLLLQISAELQTPLAGAWYVGDAKKDVELALATGCKPILVRTGKGAQTMPALTSEQRASTHVVADLAEAARFILATGAGAG